MKYCSGVVAAVKGGGEPVEDAEDQAAVVEKVLAIGIYLGLNYFITGKKLFQNFTNT